MLPDTTPDSRPLARRQPLGDVTAAANNAATPTNTTTTTPAVAAAIAAFRSPPPAAAVPQGKKKPAAVVAVAATTTTTPTTAPAAPAITPAPPTTTTRATRTLHTLSGALLFRRKKRCIGRWKLGRTLGKGANGKVKEARHVVTGEMAAVKIVRKERGEVPGNVAREVAVMAVLGGLGVGDEGGKGGLVGLKDVFENGREVYLILTHIPHGDLHTYISTHGPLPEPHALALLQQLLSAVSTLHSHNLSHRDLKPENILLSFPSPTSEPVLHLADFGLAALSPPHTLHTTACGSPHYVAPEIVLGNPYSGPAVDAWAVGVIFYAMLTGTLPFSGDGDGTQRMLGRIVEGRWALPRSVKVSRVAKEVLRGLLCRNVGVGGRWSVGEAGRVVSGGQEGEEIVYVDGCGGDEDEEVREEGRRGLKRSEIDLGILRALGSLCWWVAEEDLLASLTADGPNQEKRIYHAISRFRAAADEKYTLHR